MAEISWVLQVLTDDGNWASIGYVDKVHRVFGSGDPYLQKVTLVNGDTLTLIDAMRVAEMKDGEIINALASGNVTFLQNKVAALEKRLNEKEDNIRGLEERESKFSSLAAHRLRVINGLKSEIAAADIRYQQELLTQGCREVTTAELKELKSANEGLKALVKLKDGELKQIREHHVNVYNNQVTVINGLQEELNRIVNELKRLKTEVTLKESMTEVPQAEIAHLRIKVKELAAELEREKGLNGCITEEGKYVQDQMIMQYRGEFPNAWTAVVDVLAESDRVRGNHVDFAKIERSVARIFYHTPKKVLRVLEKYATEEKRECFAVINRVDEGFYATVKAWMMLFCNDDNFTEEKIIKCMKSSSMDLLDLLKSEIEERNITTIVCKEQRMVYDGKGVFVGEDVVRDE